MKKDYLKPLFFGVLLAALLCGCSVLPVTQAQATQPLPTEPPASPTPARPLVSLGYYTGSQGSYNAVQEFTPYLTMVSSDVFAVQLDGSIAGGDDFGVLAYDQAHGIQSYLCVSNYNENGFDPELAHSAIVTNRGAVISGLLTMALMGGYDGVNIDFESLAYSADIEEDRAAFSAFIHELAEQLHANNLKLMISTPAKTEDSPENTWAYPFDYAALGQDADYIQLMTYDLHGPWSEPGPVSGADWVEECILYALTQIDASRLLIGLPAYGYDWNLTAATAESFSWTDIPALLALPGAVTNWDTTAQSPSVTYTRDGHDHVAWYENPESIRIKTALAAKYQLAGLSMWSLGQEDQSFWQAALNGMTQTDDVYLPLITGE